MAPTDDTSFEEQVQLSSLHDIEAQGISIRVGNQIIKFMASDKQDILVEDEVKNELQVQYDEEYDKLKGQYDTLLQSTKDQARTRTRELDSREKELRDRSRELVMLPTLSEEHVRAGLTVSKAGDRRFLWSYICVYAPKYVSDKIIDPNFAKRLMTPIRIFMYTDADWKVTSLKLVKLINCEKFQHYHATGGNSDCWGEMEYSGEMVDTPDRALTFIKRVQAVLETINRFSIGNDSPRGLSRLSTVENNLLSERPDPQNDKRSGTVGRRNDRAGFDENVNAGASDDLWDANG